MTEAVGAQSTLRRMIALLTCTMVLSVSILLLNPYNEASGLEVHEGYIYGDHYWSSSDSPVEIMGNLTIPGNSSLTIDHGTTVRLKEGCWIHVQGILEVTGSPTSQVTIVSSGPGPLDRINFTAGSRGYLDNLNLSFTNRGIHAYGTGTIVNLHNSTVWSNGIGLTASSSSLVNSINTSYTASSSLSVSNAVVHEGYWFFFKAVQDNNGNGVKDVQVRVNHKKSSEQEYEEWTAFDSVDNGIESDGAGELPPIAVDKHKHNGFRSTIPVNITMKWSRTDEQDRTWGKNLDDGIYVDDNLELTWTMDFTPPPPPTNLRAANVSDTWIELVWDQETVPDLSEYELRYKKTWEKDFSFDSFGTGLQPHKVDELTPEETYVFELRALDFHSINSTPAIALIDTLDLEKPLSPVDFRVENVGGDWAHLKWDSSPSDDVTMYEIELFKAGHQGNSTFFQTDFMELSRNITGLPSETSYHARIQCFDDAITPNNSTWTNWIYFSTDDVTPPVAPIIELYPLHTVQMDPEMNFYNTTVIGFTFTVPGENRTILEIYIDNVLYEDPDGEIEKFTTFKGQLQYYIRIDPGYHTLRVRSVDPFGNIGPYSQTSFVVDKVDPEISSNIPFGSKVYIDLGEPLVAAVNASDENGIHHINWTIQGGITDLHFHGEELEASLDLGNYTVYTTAYDLAGNWMRYMFEVQVRTPDLVLPEVMSIIPEDGSVDVELGPTIKVYFSERIQSNSITASLFESSEGNVIDLSIEYDEDQMILTAYPLEDLLGGLEYTFRISKFLDSRNNDGGPFSISFTTIPSEKIDTDGDGIPDNTELMMSFLSPSDPTDAVEDFDKDGVSNVDEYNAGTAMDDPDTDKDGMTDGWEIEYGLDPINLADATTDADDDGYSNLKEFETGTDPLDPSSKPEADQGSNVLFIIISILIVVLLIAGIVIFMIIMIKRRSVEELSKESENGDERIQVEQEGQEPNTWAEQEESLKGECASCGATLQEGMDYCPECGATIVPEVMEESSMDEEVIDDDLPSIEDELMDEDLSGGYEIPKEGPLEEISDDIVPPSLEEVEP